MEIPILNAMTLRQKQGKKRKRDAVFFFNREEIAVRNNTRILRVGETSLVFSYENNV